MAPLVAGNVFMVFFGRNLDSHESKKHTQKVTTEGIRALQSRTSSSHSSTLETLLRETTEKSFLTDDKPQCLEGKSCYVAALYLTTVATFVCILLSLFAGWRARRRLQNREV